MSAFVLFRLDYCNSLFVDFPDCLLNKLQRTEIMLLTLYSRSMIMSLLLCDLHWLPVEAPIEFRITILCYLVVHGLAPIYLFAHVSPYQPGSTHASFLTVPHIRLERFGHHLVSVSGPSMFYSYTLSLCS